MSNTIKKLISTDFNDPCPIGKVVIKLCIQHAGRIVGSQRFEYDSDICTSDLEDALFDEVIKFRDYFVTDDDGKYHADLLAQYVFMQPQAYENGIEITDVNNLQYLRNVNRRKLQYLINKQYPHINLPTDRAIFDLLEWQQYQVKSYDFGGKRILEVPYEEFFSKY